MTEALTVRESRLKRHFVTVQASLGHLTHGLQVNVEWGVDPVVAGLLGGTCERIPRNRGGRAFVAPVHRIRGAFWAWLGFHEEWDVRSRRGRPIFSFRSTSLTIHFGHVNNGEKPQMFRAEWDGGGRVAGDERQGRRDAAHPHWQFDALESLRSDETEAAELLSLLKEEVEADATRDFNPEDWARENNGDMTAARDGFSRLHFASAAAWWLPAPGNRHVHVPASVDELESWLAATVNYTVGELRRL